MGQGEVGWFYEEGWNGLDKVRKSHNGLKIAAENTIIWVVWNGLGGCRMGWVNGEKE